MRTSTFNYIKDILADFYKTEEYIRQREEELRHPYQEAVNWQHFSVQKL